MKLTADNIFLLIIIFFMIMGMTVVYGSVYYKHSFPTEVDIDRMKEHNQKLVEKLILVNKDWSGKALFEYISYKEGTKND